MKPGWTCALLFAIGVAGCGPSSDVVVAPSGSVQNNFVATWEILSVRTGAVDCEQVGAATVDLAAIDLASGARVSFTFPCDGSRATAGPIAPGRFDVLLELNDANGAVLSQAELGAETVTSQGTIDLAHALFQVP